MRIFCFLPFLVYFCNDATPIPHSLGKQEGGHWFFKERRLLDVFVFDITELRNFLTQSKQKQR